MKPRIVVSGVNLVEGGPLAVFNDALDELSQHWSDRYEIVALVNSRKLFHATNVTYREFPKIKSSWSRRIYFEYRQCFSISRDLQPALWLALHDMTPRVEAAVRAVYCHNPAPFYRIALGDVRVDWKFSLFTLLYSSLYRVNLHRNDFVIVQQQWLRKAFGERYEHPSIIVAHPSVASVPALPPAPKASEVFRFFYPALPRSFKNLEVVLAAARILECRGIHAFEIDLTVDGTESRYAASLRRSYRELRTVRWLGLQSRAWVQQLYAETDCLIFASKLETWGMPISEFRQTGKPMLLADLPYAHETASVYSQLHFFAANDPEALAKAMANAIDHTLVFYSASVEPIAAPFAQDWRQLFEMLLSTCEPS